MLKRSVNSFAAFISGACFPAWLCLYILWLVLFGCKVHWLTVLHFQSLLADFLFLSFLELFFFICFFLSFLFMSSHYGWLCEGLVTA